MNRLNTKEQQKVDKDIKDAIITVGQLENEAQQVKIPSEVTVSVGDNKVIVDTNNLTKTIKDWLPYIIVIVWYIFTYLCTQMNWTIPFTNQEFTDFATITVSFILTIVTTWRDNPITSKAKLQKAVGNELTDLIKANQETPETTQAVLKVDSGENTTVEPK